MSAAVKASAWFPANQSALHCKHCKANCLQCALQLHISTTGWFPASTFVQECNQCNLATNLLQPRLNIARVAAAFFCGLCLWSSLFFNHGRKPGVGIGFARKRPSPPPLLLLALCLPPWFLALDTLPPQSSSGSPSSFLVKSTLQKFNFSIFQNVIVGQLGACCPRHPRLLHQRLLLGGTHLRAWTLRGSDGG